MIVELATLLGHLLEDVRGSFNQVTEFAQNPDKRDLAFILDDLISLDASHQRHEIVNKVRILSQNVLEHLDSLSGDICDLQSEEVFQLCLDGLRQLWQPNNNGTKALDRALGDLSAHICDVFAQLVDDLLNVAFAGDLRQDLKFQVLDVAWLVVLDEKLLVLGFENEVGSAEDQKVDVRQDIEGDLIALCGLTRRHQSDQRGTHTMVDLLGQLGIAIREVKEYFNRTEDDT